jgi:outer membrane protein, heavy metal efflux system
VSSWLALAVCSLTGRANAETPNAPSHASEGQPFRPTATTDLPLLRDWVTRRSPRLQQELLASDAAEAEVKQSKLLDNPQLDGSWGTIPVGPTTPAGLSSPLTTVPSYGIGLSYTFPLGKRGPRQRKAKAEAEAASANALAIARDEALDLARVLGEMAVATLRVRGLSELVDQQKASITLAESRVTSGFATPLDLDRLVIERSRTEQQVFANEVLLRRAQAACSSLVASRCETFASTEEARGFLSAWIRQADHDAGSPAPEARPDVRALEATRRSFQAEAELAKATAIPDPTVRVGYLYDQFVLSGNQRHSVNLSVSIPLPVFDSGRTKEAGAQQKEARAGAARARILDGASARIESLRGVLVSQDAQREVLLRDMLPKARQVVADLERAASTRLIPLTDVIQARRTLLELLVQEAETQGEAFETSIDLLAETSSDGARRQ